MNNNDNSRYLSKTKLRKFNKIIKKANPNDEEYIFYYNFKHIKIFLFQN